MNQCALFRWCLCLVLVSALVAFSSTKTLAEESEASLLLPDSPRGFVELSAFRLTASLECNQETCSIQVKHTYYIKNRDRIKQAEIVIKAQGYGWSVTFEPASSAQPSRADAWALRLAPEETITAHLQYTETLQGRHFLHWAWDASSLQRWGPLISMRVEFHFPMDVSQQIILAQSPSAHGFDGRSLYWEYETPSSLPMIDLWIIAPPTWYHLEELQQQADGFERAQFLQELRAEILARQVPYPDPYPRILAELASAAENQPSAAAYLALAQTYLQRAEELPSLASNYRLLAARTLEKALTLQSQETAIHKQLGEIYYTLAQEARQNGHLTEALQYLERARKYQDHGLEALEEMTLAWAADMAAKGQTTMALTRAVDVFSPRMRDALFHYAPLIVAAHTEITLTTSLRTAVYHLYLYPPLAKEAAARLQALIDALNAFEPGCAQWHLDGTEEIPQAWVTLSFPYVDLSDLKRVQGFFAKVAPDLLHAYLAAPWESVPEKMSVRHTSWFDQYLYRETPRMDSLLTLRDEQVQYTTWRLIEVASEHPQEGRAKIEQQLTALALRDQRDIWENLASSSSWTYHVVFAPSAFSPAWLIGWGQKRSLVFTYRIYHWEEIAKHLGLGMGGLALIVLWFSLRRKRHIQHS